MRKVAALALALAALTAGLVLWPRAQTPPEAGADHRSAAAPTAGASEPQTGVAVVRRETNRQDAPRRTVELLPPVRVDGESEAEFRRRMVWRDSFMEWVTLNHITNEQVTQVLEVLADAHHDYWSAYHDLVGAHARADWDPEVDRESVDKAFRELHVDGTLQADVEARVEAIVGPEAAQYFRGRFYLQVPDLVRSGMFRVSGESPGI